MIVSGYMNFFTVAYVFRFSIFDSSTHKSKLILCAVDIVIMFYFWMVFLQATCEKTLGELFDDKVDL